jgi:hypothetical protein
VNSATATVTVCQPPTITVQPNTPSAVNAYSTTGTQVTATGTSLTYQWYLGLSGDTSLPVSGATQQTFTASLARTNSYWVRVSGSCGSADSQAVFLSVNPTILQQPQGSTVGAGATATLSLNAYGSYLHYQWRNGNGTPVSGAPDAPTFITPSMNGDTDYYCVVSSGTGTVPSTSAHLTLCYSSASVSSVSVATSGTQRVLTANTHGIVSDISWYKGGRGDTSQRVSSGYMVISVPASSTDHYWARVFGDAGQNASCYADSPAVAVP